MRNTHGQVRVEAKSTDMKGIAQVHVLAEHHRSATAPCVTCCCHSHTQVTFQGVGARPGEHMGGERRTFLLPNRVEISMFPQLMNSEYS